MLTVLTVEEGKRRGWGFAGVDRIKRKILSSAGYEVRHLVYKTSRGRLNSARISRRAADGRGDVVYSAKPKLCENERLRQHSPESFRGLMCVNAAAAIVRGMAQLPRDFRIGIYDPKGDCPQVCEVFLSLTDNVVVVSGNQRIYTAQSRKLLYEEGAVLSVSRRLSALENCGIVVAPVVIGHRFMIRDGALVLSCSPPAISLSFPVYYRYRVKLPCELLPLCPEGVDTDVMASALFSHYRLYSLGALVPEGIASDTAEITKNQAQSRLNANFGT